MKARPRAPTRKTEEAVDRARTMEVSRLCSLAIAQQLVFYEVSVSTAVLGRVTRTMFVAPLLSNNLKQKRSNFHSPVPPPCS